MTEAGDMVQTQFAHCPFLLDNQVLDLFSQQQIAGFAFYDLTASQLQRQYQVMLAGEFQIIVVITIDGLILFTHRHNRSPIS
ncbi:hypothetical [Yersinia pestis KIM10+]|uniref:Uncharacterized protein n=1 Tax=Yersinia pestis TaxID=632 RepID=Q8CKQ3_YERPE|nr:hypothetical [Yersinia pestis KIM10+]